MIFNLIVIFISFTGISFLKYVTKIFCISYYFQENIWKYFKVQLSVTLFVYILSIKGANELQVLFIKTLGNIQGKFSTKAVVLKCILSIFFLEICRSFRQHQKSLLWKILSWHIKQVIGSRRYFLNCPPEYFCVFCVSYINQNHNYLTDP